MTTERIGHLATTSNVPCPGALRRGVEADALSAPRRGTASASDSRREAEEAGSRQGSRRGGVCPRCHGPLHLYLGHDTCLYGCGYDGPTRPPTAQERRNSRAGAARTPVRRVA